VPSISTIVGDRLRAAIVAAFGADHGGADPQIGPSKNPKFGDYQANVAMGLGKRLNRNPREVAQAIIEDLDVKDVCRSVEIAGPGFINLHLEDAFLAERLAAAGADARLGVDGADPAQTVVVDYSSPNVAKEMHVGHLRSTVIGDCIARVLGFLGHRVIRQNHLGDWGTQFGMLIQMMLDGDVDDDTREDGDLNARYKVAQERFESDPDFATGAREAVVKLQGGDERVRGYWQKLVKQSKGRFEGIYARLGVLLTHEDFKGESEYNDALPGVIEHLQDMGLLETSDGARVVYPKGFTDRDGNPQAMIVQKSDGGYLYATTDLAAAQYRIGERGADRLVYVTGAPQRHHFAMAFQVIREAGWAGDDVRLEFVPFGTILGKDGKPFKTRAGETVRLLDLLDEAEQRAVAVIDKKNPDLSESDRHQIAHRIGIGAVKYADLCNDRIKDYVFDWDRMLAFEGNTAPYLQNAYVRIRSIFRKGEVDEGRIPQQIAAFSEPAERVLALRLVQFPTVVAAVADSLEPHRLCTYLYELATAYHQFYEKCPVLNATSAELRGGRLHLCDMTGRTLRTGLDLLGIEVVEKM